MKLIFWGDPQAPVARRQCVLFISCLVLYKLYLSQNSELV